MKVDIPFGVWCHSAVLSWSPLNVADSRGPVKKEILLVGDEEGDCGWPLYSPELNKQVWNYLKHHGVAKAGLRSGKELRKYALERLHSLQRLPWTIRMFFLTPDTQYAAA